MANRGLVQLLEQLEADLRSRVAGIQFFWGIEDEARPATGPLICWEPRSGAVQQDTRERSEVDRITVVDEHVEIVARCVGARRLGPLESTPRKADFAASEALYVELGDVIAARHQGYYEEVGWQGVPPQSPSDSAWPIDYTFRVRVQRTTRPADLTQPTAAEGSVEQTNA